MKRFVVALFVAIASLVAFSSAAAAEGQICHSVQVQVNGEDVVSDAACTVLPV